MLFFRILTVVSLILSAASSPVNSRRSISLPISKRTGQNDANGLADPIWHRDHLESIHRKYKRATGNEPLFPNPSGGGIWYGYISVGTPPVNYSVDFDTGSSDFFLPSVSCTQYCSSHARFDPSLSSTSKALNISFDLTYGDGSSVIGQQYTDVVTISGLTVHDQIFGVASTYSSGYSPAYFFADGLMGMAFQTLSAYNAAPVFQTLYSQGALDANVFSFKISNISGSELFLGGTNPAAYVGNFTYSPVTHEKYWQIDLDGISVNGSPVLGKSSSIIDTGTTFILGNSTAVQSVINNIPGAVSAPPAIYGYGFYMTPCNSIPVLSLTFAGKPWKISQQTLNMGPIVNNGTYCLLGISTTLSSFWIIGDVFLENVYASFDFTNKQVGFAQLAAM